MEGLTEGRIVRYVLQPPEAALELRVERVAIITKVWNADGLVNLCILGEGPYDRPTDPKLTQVASGVLWATSVQYSETPTPQMWHWPKKA